MERDKRNQETLKESVDFLSLWQVHTFSLTVRAYFTSRGNEFQDVEDPTVYGHFKLPLFEFTINVGPNPTSKSPGKLKK
jgi:hypothetical protein